MNDSMERRRQLLEEARAIYSDQQTIPAVHPRYHAVYQELYPKEEKMRGTFAFRAFICFLLFTAFVAMDQRGNEKLPFQVKILLLAIGILLLVFVIYKLWRKKENREEMRRKRR